MGDSVIRTDDRVRPAKRVTTVTRRLGEALARNPRPVVTRWASNGCGLSTADIVGLLPGLQRVWAVGGPPNAVELGNNPGFVEVCNNWCGA